MKIQDTKGYRFMGAIFDLTIACLQKKIHVCLKVLKKCGENHQMWESADICMVTIPKN